MMIVKKLREKNSWTQEHLAMISGLSLRTIQRVEAGNSASLETLKSLASVFEVDISKLTEEIEVIDKTTEEWKQAPFWISFGILGIKSRKTLIITERLSFLIGVAGLVAAIIVNPDYTALLGFWGAAYYTSVCIRWVDNHKLW